MKQKLRLFMTLLLCAMLGNAWGADVTDVLDRAFTGVTGTSYTAWSNKEGTSGAVYAGNSSGDNSSIQLRSNNSNSGIVTTTSGGKVKKVIVTWESHTASNRVLQVYGKNTAYTDASDLYNTSNQGTLIGTIVYGTSTELTITGDYTYIGLRSASGAMYLSEIKITWGDGGTTIQTVATPSFSLEGGTYTEAKSVTISCATEGASIYYTTDGSAPSANNGTLYSSAININATTTLKAIAVKEGYNSSAVATATYTINIPSNLELDVIDFENDASSYVNWEFTKIKSKYNDSNISAHGDSYYGTTGGNASGSIQTKNKIATPHNLSCFVSKQTNNTTSSTWYIDVSSNGNNWENVASTSATDMSKGVWKGFSADLSEYSNVYVRVRYQGSTAIRLIDDLTLSTVPVVLEQKTIAEVRTQGTGTVLTKGVVTSINEDTETAYIQDNTAGIAVYEYDITLNVGDEITVQGTLITYNGLLEITEPTCTVNSSGNSVSPATKNISEINEDYAGSNMLQSMLVSIENATVTAVNGQNTTIQQGETTINVRDLSDVAVNDIITLTGIVGCYNQVQIVNPTIVSVVRDQYYVAGTWTSWADNKIEMIKNQDGTYSLTVENLAAAAEFKIIKGTSTWCGGGNDPNDQYWLTTDNHTDISLNIGGGGNFYMPFAGTWTFTVDPIAGTLTVDGIWPVRSYYLVGSFNNWSTSEDYKFTKDETTGKYTISKTIGEGASFKIIDSDEKWYGAVSEGDFYVEEQWINTNLSMETPGDNFYMNLSNAVDWTLTFDPATPSLVFSNYIDANAVIYQKVTDVSQIKAGKKYIIVCEASTKAMGFQGTQYNKDYRSDVGVTISSNKVDITNLSVAVLTLGETSDGKWTLFASDTQKYLTSSDSNELQNTENNEASSAHWTFVKDDENGGYEIINANYTNRYIQHNAQQPRFATYTHTQQKAYLYVNITPSFEFSIKKQATDGSGNYYATIGSLGENKNFVVKGEGIQVHTVTVSGGKINYEQSWVPGNILPGNGAYLVEGPKGDYSFPETSEEPTYPVVENMLRSTGEKVDGEDYAVTAEEMKEGNDGDNMYYKLSLRNDKIGFYWGDNGGAPFNYGTEHQAYLVVPKSETPSANAIYFDGTTGIDAVKDAKTTTGTVHTLSGIRVDAKQLPKGIYIVDGKKIVVK